MIAALQWLAKRKKIAGDFPVPCEVREANDATEISLAENEMREAMHPADQFEAFKKLADENKGEEEIAARFSVPPHVVRQRLKLAVVSPKLIAAYRKGDMTPPCSSGGRRSRRWSSNYAASSRRWAVHTMGRAMASSPAPPGWGIATMHRARHRQGGPP